MLIQYGLEIRYGWMETEEWKTERKNDVDSIAEGEWAERGMVK